MIVKQFKSIKYIPYKVYKISDWVLNGHETHFFKQNLKLFGKKVKERKWEEEKEAVKIAVAQKCWHIFNISDRQINCQVTSDPPGHTHSLSLFPFNLSC
jgi:hypothetical protein